MIIIPYTNLISFLAKAVFFCYYSIRIVILPIVIPAKAGIQSFVVAYKFAEFLDPGSSPG